MNAVIVRFTGCLNALLYPVGLTLLLFCAAFPAYSQSPPGGMALLSALESAAADASTGVLESAASPAQTTKSRQIVPGETPEGLNPAEWKSIRQQIREAQYHPAPAGEDGDLAAPNRAQNLHARFGKDGEIRFNAANRPHTKDSPQTSHFPLPTSSLSLRLTAYGYNDDLHPVPEAQPPTADKNRVEYRRGDLVEWYINAEQGVEQGFTLEKPPTPSPRNSQFVIRNLLTLALTLDTPLIPELHEDAQGVVFKNAAGQVVFTYDKLHVFDAADKALPAYFTLADAGELRIVVDDSAAVYPVVVDPLIASEQKKFNRTYTDANDNFGKAISLDGNTLLIGAPGDESCFLQPCDVNNGAAYVFVWGGASWTLQAQLIASGGAAVALSGDTALIGISVFTRNGTTWTQQANLIPDNSNSPGGIGSSVALDGDTAIIGARSDMHSGNSSGAAYVFTRRGTVWTQEAKLVADDAAERDQFGLSVALNGDTALIGAPYDDDDGDDSGSAYVFTRSDTAWTQQTKLTSGNEAVGAMFGNSVALSGDTALIGANWDSGNNSGSAYVFIRNGESWNIQDKFTAVGGWSVALSNNGNAALIGGGFSSAYISTRTNGIWSQPPTKLIANDVTTGDWFGRAVALSDNTAFIGAWLDDSGGTDSGSVYVFSHSNNTWTEQAKLTANDTATDDKFGFSMALDGDTALIGSGSGTGNHAYGGGGGVGSAYILIRDGDIWSLQAKLTADDPAADDYFGVSVALSGDTALIGADRDDDAGTNAGSAYVFIRNGTAWSLQKKLIANNTAAGDRFGSALALSGDTAFIGAARNGADPSSVYVFIRNNGIWTQQQDELSTNVPYDRFGSSIALDGDTALIGAPWNPNSSSGSAYVFKHNGTLWTQQAELSTNVPYDWFGNSVALSGDTALIGANGSYGSVYVFVHNDETWALQQELTIEESTTDNQLRDSPHYAVALNGDTALIGAAGVDEYGSDSGVVYVFIRSGTTWYQQSKLSAYDVAQGDYFGRSVALSGSTVFIGASNDDDGSTDSGSVYILNNVACVNDAPILDSSGTMQLNALDEDSINNAGSLVSELIANATGDRITDTDTGLPFGFEGISVIASDDTNNGK